MDRSTHAVARPATDPGFLARCGRLLAWIGAAISPRHRRKMRRPQRAMACALLILPMIAAVLEPAYAQIATFDGVTVIKLRLGDAADYPAVITPEVLAQFNEGVRLGFFSGMRSQGAPIDPATVDVRSAPIPFGRATLIGSEIRIRGTIYGAQYTGPVGADVIGVLCLAPRGMPSGPRRGTLCTLAAAAIFGKDRAGRTVSPAT